MVIGMSPSATEATRTVCGGMAERPDLGPRPSRRERWDFEPLPGEDRRGGEGEDDERSAQQYDRRRCGGAAAPARLGLRSGGTRGPGPPFGDVRFEGFIHSTDSLKSSLGMRKADATNHARVCLPGALAAAIRRRSRLSETAGVAFRPPLGHKRAGRRRSRPWMRV